MLKFFKKRKKDLKSELRTMLGEYEIPSFPAAVMNVLTALRDPEFSMTEVAKQIQGDPGLHVKVLKTVNSAAFGLAKKVNNLHHAVTLMGRSRIETIVLSQAVNSILPNVDQPFFNTHDFWLVSARRASLARVLALHLHPATQVESFTAGLLQDMALPILVTRYPKKYKSILEKWHADESLSLCSLERNALGYDHSTVGALMAEKWGLPDYLIAAISYHHVSDEDNRIEPAVDLVSRIRGDNEEDAAEKLIEPCVGKYGMKEEKVLELIDSAFQNAEELSLMLK
ncbi:MAG: HDOD domain-containing protein [Candidatus Latescibacteria bacterium]|nr:HDOD domain-containing protein [Candidatus Latescibacterota bacterium]